MCQEPYASRQRPIVPPVAVLVRMLKRVCIYADSILVAVESSAQGLLLAPECVLLVLVAERASESVGLSGRLGVFPAVPIGVRATADTADDPKDDRAP